MSVWSHVLFVALHPKDARVGIKEVAARSMGNTEYGIKIEEIESKREHDNRQFRVSISFCEDGDAAAQKVNKLIKDLVESGTRCIDCTATIRYLAG